MAHSEVLINNAADNAGPKLRRLKIEFRRNKKPTRKDRDDYADQRSWAIREGIREAGGNPLNEGLMSAVGKELSRRASEHMKAVRRNSERLDREVARIVRPPRPSPTEEQKAKWAEGTARLLGEKVD